MPEFLRCSLVGLTFLEHWEILGEKVGRVRPLSWRAPSRFFKLLVIFSVHKVVCLVAGPSVQMIAYNLGFERQPARCLPTRLSLSNYNLHFLP